MDNAPMHTPGPWKACAYNQAGNNIYLTAANGLNGNFRLLLTEGPDAIANARLIAAAPELLEVLQEVFANHDKVNSLDWTDRACAAMTKATKP